MVVNTPISIRKAARRRRTPKRERLIEPINYGDVLECGSASAAFDASKALDAELWYPKVK